MRYLIPMVMSLLLGGCAKPPSARFVGTFQRAFNSGNTNALLALVKWEGMPHELRSGMIWMLTQHTGEQRVTGTTLVSFETRPTIPPYRDGRKLVANLQPKFWLEVTTSRGPEFRIRLRSHYDSSWWEWKMRSFLSVDLDLRRPDDFRRGRWPSRSDCHSLVPRAGAACGVRPFSVL